MNNDSLYLTLSLAINALIIFVGLVKFIAHSCYKCKIANCSLCCCSKQRDTQAEKEIDLKKIEHTAENKTTQTQTDEVKLDFIDPARFQEISLTEEKPKLSGVIMLP